MLPLKDAIAEKHSLAEKMPFNQRMFKGELSKEEYILYLCQQLAIFQAIERFPLPHTALIRCPKVFEDIKELMELEDGQGVQIQPLESIDNVLPVDPVGTPVKQTSSKKVVAPETVPPVKLDDPPKIVNNCCNSALYDEPAAF